MSIYINMKKNKVEASYKTVYLKDNLIEKLNKIAKTNKTSFNNVVVSMLEYCTNDEEKSSKKA